MKLKTSRNHPTTHLPSQQYFAELFDDYGSDGPSPNYRKTPPRPITDFMRIDNIESERSTSRKTYTEILNVRLKKLKRAGDPRVFLEKMFEGLIGRLIHSAHKGTPKFVSFQLSNAYMDQPFFVPLRSPRQNTPDTLATAFLMLARQSGDRLRLFSTQNQIKLFAVWPLERKKNSKRRESEKERKKWRKFHGSCYQKSNWAKVKGRRRGLVEIFNDDNLCMARSIVLGMINRLHGEKEMKKLLKDPNGRQKRMAILLLEAAKISAHRKSYNIRHLDMIQKMMDTNWPHKYRLVAFHADKNFKIIYKGARAAQHNILLLHHGSHFDLIGSINSLFQARGNFCTDCGRMAYSNSHYRECIAACQLCYRFGYSYPCRTPRGQQPIICTKCGFFFPNASCYAHHSNTGKNGGASICQQRFYCRKCSKVVYKRGQKRHECSSMAGNLAFPCENCGVLRNAQEPHYCYIQPLWFGPMAKKKPETDERDKPIRYVFFDIESTQEHKVVVNGIECRKHVPNLIMAEVICSECADDANVKIPTGPGSKTIGAEERAAENCICGIWGKKCRFRQHILDADNPRLLQFNSFDGQSVSAAEQFLDFLLDHGNRGPKTVLIAHNGGKFDVHLLLSAIYSRNIAPKVIMTGLKIYFAQISGGTNRRNIIFKDSLNYLSGSLARLYDTFTMDRTGVQRKPPFPHLWNRSKNLDKPLNTLPPLRYYCTGKMKTDERADFREWYERNKEQPFDLKSALIEYCTNDVQLLRVACLEFRKIVRQLAPSVEPFLAANTIAKLALTIWRQQFLQPNLLINIPENGLRPAAKQSNEARRFFLLYSKITGKQVQTSDSVDGEHSSKRSDDEEEEGSTYWVDGFIQNPGEQPIALEYYGCSFHGCLHCFPDRRQILQGDRSAEDLYARTMIRKAELQRRGYRLIEVWQCRWMDSLKRNGNLRKIWHGIRLPPPPLNPRIHGLRGGRVEPFQLYIEAGSDEIIEHFDIVSLYPSVMKNCRYPLGMPMVYGGEQMEGMGLPPLPWHSAEFAEKFPFKGLLHVRILPPKRMPELCRFGPQPLPPFLPYRTKEGLLVFPLCAKCADKQQTRACEHTKMQRSWDDAMVDEDLRLALHLGYTILAVYEIWHWPSQQWTKPKGGAEAARRDLFRGYINTLLKIKVEASGWPANIKSAQEKAKFIGEYKEREGIELDPAKMIYNKGLREIIKLLLNALWGKLCQRPNPSSVEITKSAREFHELLDNPQIEILDVAHINTHLDRVVHRRKPEFLETPSTNNVVIAVFVTSHGRRWLFEKYIMEANRNANLIAYCDTDSLVVKRKLHQKPITEGCFLGDMTRELPDRRILRMVAAGAKNYAYLHSALDGTDVRLTRKIRGFEMTHKASQQLTFDAILDQVQQQFGEKRLEKSKLRGVPVGYSTFRRDKHGMVYTRPSRKLYKAVFKKGIVGKIDEPILPFGYT